MTFQTSAHRPRRPAVWFRARSGKSGMKLTMVSDQLEVSASLSETCGVLVVRESSQLEAALDNARSISFPKGDG
jgi:hypothetical protein